MIQDIIYGGSFNPIHDGHVEFVQCLQNYYPNSNVIVLPAKRNPLKDRYRIPNEIRLESVRETFRFWSRVRVSDREMTSDSEFSYLIDTIRAYESTGLGPLAVAMGADVLMELDQWKEYEEILRRVSIIVLHRNLEDPNQNIWQKVHELPIVNSFSYIPFFNATSSSGIRGGDEPSWNKIPEEVQDMLKGYV